MLSNFAVKLASAVNAVIRLNFVSVFGFGILGNDVLLLNQWLYGIVFNCLWQLILNRSALFVDSLNDFKIELFIISNACALLFFNDDKIGSRSCVVNGSLKIELSFFPIRLILYAIFSVKLEYFSL